MAVEGSVDPVSPIDFAPVGPDPIDLAPVDHALEELSLGVDQLVKLLDDGGLDALDDSRLVGFMQGFERIRNRMPLIDHRMIVDAERRNLADTLTQGSMTRVLVTTLRLSPAEASRRVRAADAVGEHTTMLGETLAPTRSQLADAQRAGEVSPEQVAIIERALSRVDHRGFDPADLDSGEALLTRFAVTFGPKDLRLLAEQVVDAIDPDGTRPRDELNADRRHFSMRQSGDGAWTGDFRLTGPAGAKLRSLLDSLARPRTEPELKDNPAVAPDARTRGQRMHDALEDLCDRLLRTADSRPDAGGSPATVIVTIDLADLVAKTGYAVTSDGTIIRTDEALRLADQADIYWTVVDAAGVPLQLGRSRPIATLGQTAALIARDRGCSFPGCQVPPEWCERHHIIGWVDGGETNLNNLTLLCRYHHHNFATRGWICRLDPDGLPEWTPPKVVDRHQRPMINTRITGANAARAYRKMRT